MCLFFLKKGKKIPPAPFGARGFFIQSWADSQLILFEKTLEEVADLPEEFKNLLEECDKSVGSELVIVDDVAGVLVEKITERNFDLTKEVKVTCLEELVKE